MTIHRQSTLCRCARFMAAAIAAGGLMVAPAQAAVVGTFEWTGAVSGDWTDPGNWNLAEGADAGANGYPDFVGADSEQIVFHAPGATNLNIVLPFNLQTGGVRFNANATSTVTIGGLQGDGENDDLTPIRWRIDSGPPSADFYPVDIWVEAGHHVIRGADQGSGAGNQALQFYGPQVWQIDEGTSLEFDVRVRQVSNTDTSYVKTGGGLLILSQSNSGSGGWQFAGSNNPIREFAITEGTLRFNTSGARGNTSNSFLVSDGGTLQIAAPGYNYGANNGTLELHGDGYNNQGALHLQGGTSNIGAGNGTVNIPLGATIRVDNDQLPGELTINSPVTGFGALTKTGPGTLVLATNDHSYSGNTTVAEGTLKLDASLGGGAIPFSPVIHVEQGATLDVTGHAGGYNVGLWSPQTLKGDGSVEGSIALAASGAFEVDYSGSSLDSLAISGELNIASATLSFNNVGSPLAGGSHVFATYGSLVGDSFANVINLPDGFSIDYNFQGGNQIALVGGTPVVAGDFNSDGNVDGADFVIWQTNFPNNTGGATLDMGDANGDGHVDGADFVVWQTNFPTTAGSVTPVPEPSAFIMGLTVLAGAAFVARRATTARR